MSEITESNCQRHPMGELFGRAWCGVLADVLVASRANRAQAETAHFALLYSQGVSGAAADRSANTQDWSQQFDNNMNEAAEVQSPNTSRCADCVLSQQAANTPGN